MNFRPARAAAAAMSSGPLRPSDLLVWTWTMPAIVPSVGAESASGRGGRVRPTQTATAAAMAAVASRNFFTNSDFASTSDPRARLQRRRFVGSLPREFRLRAAEVAERSGLLVDRTAQVE